MSILAKLRGIFVTAKVYGSRITTYITLLNLYILVYLTLSDVKKYGVYIKLEVWLIPILCFLTLLVLGLGWLDDKIGVFKEELRFTTNRNPQVMETLNELKKINERLDRLEKKWKR